MKTKNYRVVSIVAIAAIAVLAVIGIINLYFRHLDNDLNEEAMEEKNLNRVFLANILSKKFDIPITANDIKQFSIADLEVMIDGHVSYPNHNENLHYFIRDKKNDNPIVFQGYFRGGNSITLYQTAGKFFLLERHQDWKMPKPKFSVYFPLEYCSSKALNLRKKSIFEFGNIQLIAINIPSYDNNYYGRAPDVANPEELAIVLGIPVEKILPLNIWEDNKLARQNHN